MPSPAWSFWWPPLARLTLVAIAAVVVELVFGAASGLIVAAGGFLVLILVQLSYLQSLQRWLIAPRAEDIPEGWGAWGDVFAELYKARRREQKNRDKLASALERFMQAAQALPDTVVILDTDDRIEWCNSSAHAQLGLTVPRDRGQVITNLVRYPEFGVYLAGADHREALSLRTHAARPRVLSIQIIPFGEAEKLLLSRDVTTLERTETIRRDFVANVSHELRTPLTVINGFLEHLTEGKLEANSAKRQLNLMREQALRMTRLVEDLLTLSRLEAGDNPLREEEVDVPRLAASLLEEGRTLSNGRHSLSADVEPVLLRGSTDELRGAFSNLVSNAIRYTPEGGSITLRWSRDRETGDACFSVSDTGIGIAPEHIPRLTERFYRIDRSRSRETGGTGLGLAIVKHVLLRHQAMLEIESEPGRGSTFSCVFPAARIITASMGQESSEAY